MGREKEVYIVKSAPIAHMSNLYIVDEIMQRLRKMNAFREDDILIDEVWTQNYTVLDYERYGENFYNPFQGYNCEYHSARNVAIKSSPSLQSALDSLEARQHIVSAVMCHFLVGLIMHYMDEKFRYDIEYDRVKNAIVFSSREPTIQDQVVRKNVVTDEDLFKNYTMNANNANWRNGLKYYSDLDILDSFMLFTLEFYSGRRVVLVSVENEIDRFIYYEFVKTMGFDALFSLNPEEMVARFDEFVSSPGNEELLESQMYSRDDPPKLWCSLTKSDTALIFHMRHQAFTVKLLCGPDGFIFKQ